MPKTFSFTGARKIVFGCGTFAGLAGQIRDLRAKKPFIAMDGNLAKLGMRDKVMEMFDREGLKAVLYDRVLPEPPLEQADEGAKLAQKGKCDIVVGIGHRIRAADQRHGRAAIRHACVAAVAIAQLDVVAGEGTRAQEQPRADPRTGPRPELRGRRAVRAEQHEPWPQMVEDALPCATGDRPQRQHRNVGHRDDDLVRACARERGLHGLDAR